MNENEKLIIKIFTTISKQIGGRGAKNIHVKEKTEEIEIHFLLCKSLLEEFIYKKFPNGEKYLENMHKQIFSIISKDFDSLLNEQLPFKVKIKEFQFNVNNDKYLIILEKLMN